MTVSLTSDSDNDENIEEKDNGDVVTLANNEFFFTTLNAVLSDHRTMSYCCIIVDLFDTAMGPNDTRGVHTGIRPLGNKSLRSSAAMLLSTHVTWPGIFTHE